jgi:hypothetical protein
MEDRDFFDLLFQQFAKTTRAEDTYWMTYEVPDKGSWSVHAADKDDVRTIIATNLSEVDADFITAVHGCLPDLVRRLHDALDEADRADSNRDEREQEVFRLALENQELREECARLEEILATARSKAADVLWKTERPM